jgi:ParB family chromosome partitioning protein
MGRRRIEGSALAGTATAPAAVPVSSIAHNPRNLRDNYSDVAELASSIKEVGILQPLGVVRYELFLTHYPDFEREVGNCDWVVLHGNRRLAAAKLIDLPEVPVHVVDRLGRDDQFDESVLIENIHREKLPPLREAMALQELVDRHGTQTEVAKRIGRTVAYVSQRIGLLRLVPELQDALKTGTMSFEDARTLSSIDKADQLPQWERLQQAYASQDNPEAARESWAAENRAQQDVEAKPAAGRPKAASRGRPRVKTVKVGTPEETAEQLRKHLAPAELAILVELLLKAG